MNIVSRTQLVCAMSYPNESDRKEKVMKVSGKCLCGSVELKGEIKEKEISACHCDMCRKWSGSPMMAVDCGDSLTFTDQEMVTNFPSSEWADRGFCKQCGTHLFYLLKPANQYHVPAGLLDLQSECVFTHQIFIEEKPEYYSFANDTKNMTGAEVFAHFENEQ